MFTVQAWGLGVAVRAGFGYGKRSERPERPSQSPATQRLQYPLIEEYTLSLKSDIRDPTII